MKAADRSGATIVVVVGDRRRRGRRVAQVKDMTSAASRSRWPGRYSRTHSPTRLHSELRAHGRTCGDSYARRRNASTVRTSARRSRWLVGSPAVATTVGWPSSICAMRAESCRWSFAMPRSRTGCATSTASRIVGEVQARPEGNENPELPTGGIEVHGRRCRRAVDVSAPLPFPIDDRVDRRRGGAAASTATWTCAARRPANMLAHALEGQPDRPRRAPRPRLHRDRDADPDALDARGRARLPGAEPRCSRATGTRCRSRRSCSSSC